MKVMDVMKMKDVESIELRIETDETIRFRFKDVQFLQLFDVVLTPYRKPLAFKPHPNSCYYASDILNTDLHDDYYAKGGLKLCLKSSADQWRPQMGPWGKELLMLGWSPFYRLGKRLKLDRLFIRYRQSKDGIPRKAKSIYLPYVCEPCPGVPEWEDLYYNPLSKSWQDESGAMHIEVRPETDDRVVNE